MINLLVLVNLLSANQSHNKFHYIAVNKNYLYLKLFPNSGSWLCYTSGSVLKRTDMILRKTQPLLLFSFFPVFHLSHIDECKDSILTRSWLDNYAHRREECSVFFDDDPANNPRLGQTLAAKTRQHKTLPSTLFVEFSKLARSETCCTDGSLKWFKRQKTMLRS